MFYHLTNKKGSALVIVLLIMVVMSILGTAVLRIALAETKFASHQEDKIQAYYIARSGAQATAEYMIKDANNDAHEFIEPESDLESGLRGSGLIGGGDFEVTVSGDIANNVVNIVSVGEYNGIQQQAKIRVTRSFDGLGGIFQHAIAAKQGILVSGDGNKTEIVGTIATKEDAIVLEKAESTGDPVYDPNLIFPPIVLPPDRTPTAIPYNLELGNIAVDTTVQPINSSEDAPTYVSTGSIYRQNNTIDVIGKGVVHMYVSGNITMATNSKFNVSDYAKLYVYVVGERTVSLSGNGSQNNIYLYAPDSHIEWNNAQPSNDFFGTIIGKTVTLHNQLTIRYNPDMVNEVDLDTTGVGATFTGYTWID